MNELFTMKSSKKKCRHKKNKKMTLSKVILLLGYVTVGEILHFYIIPMCSNCSTITFDIDIFPFDLPFHKTSTSFFHSSVDHLLIIKKSITGLS